MTPESVMTVGKEAIEVSILLLAVILLPVLGIGLLVSMFQAATQINEMTLSFVPKLVVMFVTILFAGGWMLGILMDYTSRLIESIPNLIG
ncbi:MAG: flagellar biosynthesis protein FliQ [Gammaproteobacteria bacterium]|nr:flagellar biosynthesis protein FliQ [Gammaproteobacteria bacterium]